MDSGRIVVFLFAAMNLPECCWFLLENCRKIHNDNPQGAKLCQGFSDKQNLLDFGSIVAFPLLASMSAVLECRWFLCSISMIFEDQEVVY